MTRWPPTVRYAIIFLLLVVIGRIHEVIPGVGALPIANVAVAFAIIALMLGGYFKRLPLIFRAPPIRWVFLLLGLGALSAPFALWPGGAVSALIVAAKLWVLCILVPVATATSDQLATVAKTFAIAAALLVAGYVLEALGLRGFTASQSLGFDRNEVALFGAMGIPYALAWSGADRRIGSIGLGLTGFLVAGIVATGSRGGFLAMMVVGTVFLIRSRLLSVPKKTAIVVAAFGMAAVVGTGEYWDRVVAIFADPTGDYNFQEREGRIEIWKRGLGYAASNPLTGVGFGNFPVAEGQTLEDLGYGVKWSTAHSAFVLVLGELGIPGIVVFLVLLGSVARETVRAAQFMKRERGPPSRLETEAQIAYLAEATQLAFVAYVVGALFLSVAYSAATLFLVSVASVLHLLRMQLLATRAHAHRRRAQSRGEARSRSSQG